MSESACSGTGAMITRPPVSISRGRVKHAGPFSPGKLRLCNLLEVHRILLSAILPRASRFECTRPRRYSASHVPIHETQ